MQEEGLATMLVAAGVIGVGGAINFGPVLLAAVGWASELLVRSQDQWPQATCQRRDQFRRA
jgi:hypothetical protein